MRKTLSLLILTASLIATSALAKPASRRAAAKKCEGRQAKTSVYFVPKIKDYCPSPTPCQAFKNAVRMEGSGLLAPDKRYVYVGATKRQAAHFATESAADCPTAKGASGDCLMPFLSIAADRRSYRMGDIVEMPALRGQEITLPDGRVLTHPGYVIVQDVGGAIRGENRFDFFTGTYRERDPKSRFSVNGDLSMADENSCDSHKKIGSILRRSKTDTKYLNALAAIQGAHTGAHKPLELKMASADTDVRTVATETKDGVK